MTPESKRILKKALADADPAAEIESAQKKIQEIRDIIQGRKPEEKS